MHTQTSGSIPNQATPNARNKGSTYLNVPKRLLSSWIWHPDPSKRLGKRLILLWRSNVETNERTLEELRRMSKHELADIGLSHSDLTPEGLAIAGAKRALRQDLISADVAELAAKHKANWHGN